MTVNIVTQPFDNQDKRIKKLKILIVRESQKPLSCCEIKYTDNEKKF